MFTAYFPEHKFICTIDTSRYLLLDDIEMHRRIAAFIIFHYTARRAAKQAPRPIPHRPRYYSISKKLTKCHGRYHFDYDDFVVVEVLDTHFFQY